MPGADPAHPSTLSERILSRHAERGSCTISSQAPKLSIAIRYISRIAIQRSGNECKCPRSVAAVFHLVDLLLIDIKSHCTARSHNSHLILMTQARMNGGATTKVEILGMSADIVNKFTHLI